MSPVRLRSLAARVRFPSLAVAAVVGVLAGRTASADEPTKQECVVANESAQDLQGSGKLVEARAALLTCADRACPGAVRQDCSDRLLAVGQALPTVVLRPRDAGGRDVAGAAVAIDGVAQPAVLDGTPVAVDPGSHTFTVTLTGRQPASLRLSLREGDRVRRDVLLKVAPAGQVARPAPEGEGRPGAVPAPAPAEAEKDAVTTRAAMHRIMWAAIGAGAAGVTLGTLFGFVALGKKGSLDRMCQGTSCPPGAQGDIDAMHVDAVAANVSFAVGLLGLGAGGALLFAFPENQASGGRAGAPRDGGAILVRPWAGLGDVGVRGTFR